MLELISVALIFVLLPAVVFGSTIFVIIRRGLQMKQLVADGVETTGLILERSRDVRSRSGARHRSLRYEYHDSLGRAHTHRSVVPDQVWKAHMEGGPIEIVYSQSRTAVSAPKYLIEQVRPRART